MRLDQDLLAWADSQSAQRGVSRTDVIEGALRALRDGRAPGALPPAPVSAERVPSPAETGTAHWRDPSPEEVEDSRLRFEREYPGRDPLPEGRLLRLARADAKARDQGRLPPLGAPVGRGDFAKLSPEGFPTNEPGARETSFEVATQQRASFFRTLKTPDSAKGIKPKDG